MLAPSHTTTEPDRQKGSVIQQDWDLKEFARVFNYVSDGGGVTVYSACELRIDR
jgi:hypothetical protein